MRDYYAEFAGRLEMEGVQALASSPVIVDEDTRHQVQYVPFEYVNPVTSSHNDSSTCRICSAA